METLVVNMFGAPGAGKSTSAAYVYAQLKLAGINAEIVTEFAKDKVWEGNDEVFKNQAYIFGKQSFKITRLLGKVDVIITDSPLLLSAHYNEQYSEIFDKFVLEVFNMTENINFFIERVKAYNPKGRFQNEQESNTIAGSIKGLLESTETPYIITPGNIEGYDLITGVVMDILKDHE